MSKYQPVLRSTNRQLRIKDLKERKQELTQKIRDLDMWFLSNSMDKDWTNQINTYWNHQANLEEVNAKLDRVLNGQPEFEKPPIAINILTPINQIQ